jgi:hypothetical protein
MPRTRSGTGPLLELGDGLLELVRVGADLIRVRVRVRVRARARARARIRV